MLVISLTNTSNQCLNCSDEKGSVAYKRYTSLQKVQKLLLVVDGPSCSRSLCRRRCLKCKFTYCRIEWNTVRESGSWRLTQTKTASLNDKIWDLRGSLCNFAILQLKFYLRLKPRSSNVLFPTQQTKLQRCLQHVSISSSSHLCGFNGREFKFVRLICIIGWN